MSLFSHPCANFASVVSSCALIGAGRRGFVVTALGVREDRPPSPPCFLSCFNSFNNLLTSDNVPSCFQSHLHLASSLILKCPCSYQSLSTNPEDEYEGFINLVSLDHRFALCVSLLSHDHVLVHIAVHAYLHYFSQRLSCCCWLLSCWCRCPSPCDPCVLCHCSVPYLSGERPVRLRSKTYIL